jgi:hypothetical protein
MFGALVSTVAFSPGLSDEVEAKPKCTGAGTLPGDGPFCYAAKIGMLGVTEKLSLRVTRTTGDTIEKGQLDLVGSGISPFACRGIAITKNGQDVQVDQSALSKCLPRGVTLVSTTYCSDTDEVSVSVRDKNIPLSGTISRAAGRVDCGDFESVATDLPGRFNAWAMEHNRVYPTGEEAVSAFSAFVANDEVIAAHNLRYLRGETSYYLGHNAFSDVTRSKFRGAQRYNMTQAAIGLKKIPQHATADGEVLPTAVDWSTVLGCETRVKNQKSCGSCWAFSAVGAIEAQLCGQELSEQDLVSCDKSDNGCQGGSMESAFEWVHKHGIASESGYAYKASDSYCDTSKEKRAVATVSGAMSVNGESSLKSAVAMQAVSIGVDASCLQSYHGGIIDQPGCSGQLDHGVLAVGYGTESGKAYFKVKNSWGASWGESGYFRVAAGKGMLGIGQQGVYPTGVSSVSPGPTPGPTPGCTDTSPDASATCAEQKEWGKCSRSWMKGYCCKTCFGCSSGCGS